MKITVHDFRNAPKWIRVWNLINLFIAGFVIGRLGAVGFNDPLLIGFSFYAGFFTLIIGHYFTPKKVVRSPKEFLYHFVGQFRVI